MGKRAVFGILGAAMVGALSLAGIGLGMAGIERPARPGPVPHARFDPALVMTPQIERLITRSCADCHSSGPDLPWYARVPPASWMIARDMRKARKAMNLSAWSTQNGRKTGIAVGTLAAMCEDVKSGRMPDRKYLWMHPEAKMNAAEIKIFCGWTSERMALLRKP